MKNIFKKTIFFLFDCVGISFLVGRVLDKKVTCVGYHSVYDEKNKKEFSHELYANISVSTADFEKQLLSLKRAGHTFITFADLKKPELKKCKKPTIIYFDDGYKDNLVNAFPILHRLGIPATVFVTVGLIERTCFLWTLGLRQFLYGKNTPHVEVEQKIENLKKLSKEERKKALRELYAQDRFQVDPNIFNIFMTWDDVCELSRGGMEIGSHGMLHNKFSEAGEEELRAKVVNSKRIIEQKIGKKIDTISYPYGDHNRKVVNVVKEAGYSFAVTVIDGYNSFEDIMERPFELKRINPGSNHVVNLTKIFLRNILSHKYFGHSDQISGGRLNPLSPGADPKYTPHRIV